MLFAVTLTVGAGLDTGALAGPNESTDLVAPYVHIPLSEPIAGAAGPPTTLFIIRSTSTTPVPPLGLGVQVRVTCFNSQSEVISAMPSTGASISQPQSFAITPERESSFIPTLHPNFTGLG